MVDPHARRTKTAGLALLALGVALFLLLGVGELADGDVAGIQHLVPALVLGVLLWAGRRRPLLVGVVLLALGLALAATYGVLLAVRDVEPASAPIVVLPPLAAGLLLVAAGRAGGQAASISASRSSRRSSSRRRRSSPETDGV